MNEALLTIQNLCASYDEENVITGIDLTVNPGQIVCIVGESGSGKSSLVKAIHGVSELRITQGSISFDGTEIASAAGNSQKGILGRGIGLIPQDPASSFNPIRRLDVQFREALAAHRMPYDESVILDLLEKIGLPDGLAVLRNRPYELSGGMNQRIAIAAAMLFEPKLLLCDEATSALDVTSAGAVVDELLKIRERNGTAILMVTHHLGIAKRMADRIGIMKNGRIVEFGDPEKIFMSPEDPYTKRLIMDVPRLRA